jgi:hypothetical protein
MKTSNGYPRNMHFNGVHSSDPGVIAGLFCSFFQSVFNEIVSDEIDIVADTRTQPSVCLPGVTILCSEVYNKLISLDINKGMGPDGLSPLVLRRCAPHIAKPLQIIFNRSVSEGCFPKIWKTANITPIHKTGDKSDMSNYRPISILSPVSKVFESVVKDHLTHFLRPRLLEEQHGFVGGRSTVTNLLVYTEYLFSSMDKRIQVDSIYTDLKKAFDKVDHSILLSKLSKCGIHGDLLRWLKSYLTDRLMSVTMNGFSSDNIPVTSGVPQGSVLGPLLFTAFINDIGDCILHSQFLLFADDLKIYRQIRCIEDAEKLDEDLGRIYDYCVVNRLELNLKKCNSITFTKNKKIIKHNYTIDGKFLIQLEKIRDLGIIFDSKLHFEAHVEDITEQCNRTLGFILRTTKEFRDPKTMLILYVALVRSRLEYCSTIWNPLYDKYITAIERVQRKFLRMCGRRYGDAFSGNLLDLSARRELMDACILRKVCTSEVDVPQLLAKNGFRAPSDRRTNRPLSLSTAHTNAGLRNPLYRILSNYNNRFCDVDMFASNPRGFKMSVLQILNGV